jgi:hypothetical protein
MKFFGEFEVNAACWKRKAEKVHTLCGQATQHFD